MSAQPLSPRPATDGVRGELVEAVARGAGLTPEQAARAVAAMLRFVTARLPSALVGELHTRLDALPAPPASPPDTAA